MANGVIGIDPGINNLGWAILEKSRTNSIVYIASGRIKTTSSNHITVRLASLSEELSSIVEKYEPSSASIEETFVNINAKSSMILSFARGAILAILGKYHLHTSEFAPNSIKKTIVGYGKADKEQVMKMLALVIPDVKFSSTDEADAIAIAYTAIVSNIFQTKY